MRSLRILIGVTGPSVDLLDEGPAEDGFEGGEDSVGSRGESMSIESSTSSLAPLESEDRWALSSTGGCSSSMTATTLDSRSFLQTLIAMCAHEPDRRAIIEEGKNVEVHPLRFGRRRSSRWILQAGVAITQILPFAFHGFDCNRSHQKDVNTHWW